MPIWNLPPKLHQNHTVFNIHMFLSSIDFSMIMVWWFESGMIVWLQYDGVIVLFVNVVNAYKSKKLQRNVKQKIYWKNHKKYRLSFFATFPPIPRHGDSLKTSEDSRKKSSVVIWFAFVYHCVSTEDPEEQKCHFLYYHIKEIYNIKKVFRVFRNITNIHTIKPKHGWRLCRGRSSDFMLQSSGS